MRKLAYTFLALATGATLNSCRKTLDINTNPNYPGDVTIKELLPSAEASIGQVTGNYFQVVGGIWGEYWTQNPNASQYRPFEQYQPGPSTANNAWTELYSGGLTDLNKVIEKADTLTNTKNYTAIAKILQAYTFQLLTDQFGDIPFSEALKGESAGIVSPKYDKQQDVYTGIIKLITDAQNLIDPNAAGPSSDDLIYGGDMIKWYKFSNSLMLKVYLRMAYVDPAKAKAGIEGMSQDMNDYIIEGETAQISYIKDPGNRNPLYSEMVVLNRTQNLIASSTCIDSMNDRGDIRIDHFYFSTGAYAGLQQGYYSIASPGSYAFPGQDVGGIANPDVYNAFGITEAAVASAPVKLISSYESLFLLAEAAARGWFTGAPAQGLYESAIYTNFDEYSLFRTGDHTTDSTNLDYVNNFYIPAIAAYPNGSFENNLKAIITEKWYAMCGNQNIEAWTEYRRTGYPDFFVLSENSRIGAVYPARLPYPEVEVTRNLNFPGQKQVSDKVWWDVH